MLEIGALPSRDSLLALPALAGATGRLGVSLDGPQVCDGFEILRLDANDLSVDARFAAASFDTVLCNSVLEHDPAFWKSLAEMKRVLRPGGLLGVGVPGYTRLPLERRAHRLARWLGRLRVGPAILDPLNAATLTLHVHNYPGDYYRFSPQAVAEVFLDGLVDVEIQTLMNPPRILGFGTKPG